MSQLVDDLVKYAGESKPNVDQVERLLKAGVNADAKNSQGTTALMVAITGLHVDIVRLLLEEGKASVNEIQGEKLFILCYALAVYNFSSTSYGQRVLEMDAVKADEQKDREQAIVSIIRLLVKHGADVNAVGFNGMTPLHHASSVHGDMAEIALELLQHGADPNVVDQDSEDALSQGLPPLGYALQENNVEVMRVLLKHGADPNATNQEGSSLLHLAAAKYVTQSYLKIDILKQLLAHGADSSARDMNGMLPLEVACQCQNLNAAFELLTHGDFRRVVSLGGK